MMKIQVERHLFFFQEGRRILRYTETMPPHAHEASALCNCTEVVETRPAGEPYETQEVVTLFADIEVGDVTYRVKFDTFYGGFSIYFGGEGRHNGSAPHLYAWVKDTQVQFEYVKDPDAVSEVDTAALGYVYVGLPSAEVQATMYRGHSPPQINLDAFAQEVWLYDRFGSTAEATYVFRTKEANAWRQYVRVAREMMAHAQMTPGEHVVAAYQRVLGDDVLRTFFVTWAPWFANLTHHVKSSEVYEGIRATEGA